MGEDLTPDKFEVEYNSSDMSSDAPRLTEGEVEDYIEDKLRQSEFKRQLKVSARVKSMAAKSCGAKRTQRRKRKQKRGKANGLLASPPTHFKTVRFSLDSDPQWI